MGNTCSTCADNDKANDQPTANENQGLRPAINKSEKPAETRVVLEPAANTQPINASNPSAQRSGADQRGTTSTQQVVSNFNAPGNQHGSNPAAFELPAPAPHVANPPAEPKEWEVVITPNPENARALKMYNLIPKRDPRGFGETRQANDPSRRIVKHLGKQVTFEGYVNTKNQPHGWGKMVLQNGEIMEGLFEAGKPSKHLRLFRHDSYMLEGEFNLQDLTLRGSGLMYKPDGTKITCENWKDNVPQGQIIETDAQGRKVFMGVKSPNQEKQGPCEVVFGNFSIKANFKNDVIEGNGQKYYVDGRYYEGQLNKDFQEEGKGTLTFVDGRKFSGMFAKGLANSEGDFTTDTGKVVRQTWKDGKRV